MVHEGKYAYTAKVGSCNVESYWNPGAKIDLGHSDYQCSDEKIMKMVYQTGAVMTGVDASGNGWGQYKSGVYDTCQGSAGHAVTIVGWGTEQGIPYWLIKNSWGTGWGDKGFIKVKRGMYLYYNYGPDRLESVIFDIIEKKIYNVPSRLLSEKPINAL